MIFRLAELRDIDALTEMRRDFTLEYNPDISPDTFSAFEEECREFLMEAIEGDRWQIFVAEVDGQVISHIFLQLIDKMPRPGRVTHPFGYVTNVYTLPSYRGRGIGAKVDAAMQKWAKEQELEMLVVWPSRNSVTFYERNGFQRCPEAMEKSLEE